VRVLPWLGFSAFEEVSATSDVVPGVVSVRAAAEGVAEAVSEVRLLLRIGALGGAVVPVITPCERV